MTTLAIKKYFDDEFEHIRVNVKNTYRKVIHALFEKQTLAEQTERMRKRVRQQLDQLYNNIEELKTKIPDEHLIRTFTKLHEKLKEEIEAEIINNANNPPAMTNIRADQKLYSNIIQHFTSLSHTLAKNPETYTLQHLHESSTRLEKIIDNKPKLSVPVKTTICAVIGAVAGFILGGIIGAALTFFAGGAGAIPLALLGAKLGLAIGVGSATYFAAVGGTLAGTCGFFHAHKKQQEHVARQVRHPLVLDTAHNAMAAMKLHSPRH